MCPLSLAAPGTYYAIGPMAAFAFETTFTSLQRCRTVLALAFVLSCIGDRCIVDGLLTAPRTVGKFHFSCTGFPRVDSSTAVFTNVDAALAFAFVGIVVERRVTRFADLGSRDTSGRKLPVAAT